MKVDAALQTRMLRDGILNNGNPGTIVLLTGDGRGFYNGVGFHADIAMLHNRGWDVEVLAWEHSCNHVMQEWAQDNGIFIPLEEHYLGITYLEPDVPTMEPPRLQEEVDLTHRPVGEMV